MALRKLTHGTGSKVLFNADGIFFLEKVVLQFGYV